MDGGCRLEASSTECVAYGMGTLTDTRWVPTRWHVENPVASSSDLPHHFSLSVHYRVCLSLSLSLALEHSLTDEISISILTTSRICRNDSYAVTVPISWHQLLPVSAPERLILIHSSILIRFERDTERERETSSSTGERRHRHAAPYNKAELEEAGTIRR